MSPKSASKIVSVAVENAQFGAFGKIFWKQRDKWSEWQDLNLRPPRPEQV
jgi:hypothetical protein